MVFSIKESSFCRAGNILIYWCRNTNLLISVILAISFPLISEISLSYMDEMNVKYSSKLNYHCYKQRFFTNKQSNTFINGFGIIKISQLIYIYTYHVSKVSSVDQNWGSELFIYQRYKSPQLFYAMKSEIRFRSYNTNLWPQTYSLGIDHLRTQVWTSGGHPSG